MTAPTYSAREIKKMCQEITPDQDFKILAELIDEELHLYSSEDLGILIDGLMIMFIRFLLKNKFGNLG